MRSLNSLIRGSVPAFAFVTLATAQVGCGEAPDGAEMGGNTAAAVACPFESPVGGLPAAIAPPTSTKLLARTHAVGVQIYTCAAATAPATGYAFVLKAPQADLTDETCAKIGTHYAGPFWEQTDGSKVKGAKVADAPSVAGAIPMLLLKATEATGSGTLGQVSYVQRINTVGGLAPATGCDAANVGKEISVPYTADYYYFGNVAAAAPSTGAGYYGGNPY